MKNTEIIACLKENKNITAYEIKSVDKNSRELFYVLKHLEINRAVKVNTTTIKVYVSDSKTTGSSLVVVTAADNKKSLAGKLNKAVKQAKAAKNAYYPLASKKENIIVKLTKKADLNEIASKVAEAVFLADVYEQGWINSTEIFVSTFKEDFINSNGVKHSSERFSIEVECIPTWSNNKEEFELYKFYKSNKIDYKQITKEVNEILSLAKLRSQARTLKDVKLAKDVKVLVQGEMLEKIVGNLCDNLSYRSCFSKNNHYGLKDVVSNNPLSLTLKGEIKGCANSKAYDNNGIKLDSKKIINNGKVISRHGDLQFGYYLGEKDISGNYPLVKLDGERSDYEQNKYLIVENFSSPQLEASSGYWGGEIRLAIYYDGKNYIPLTGLSISGNIYEDLKDLQLSKENILLPSYNGPKYFIFKNLQIN